MTKEELITKIRSLPPEHSVVLSLLYIDKLSRTEASKIVGCSEKKIDYLSKEALKLLSTEA